MSSSESDAGKIKRQIVMRYPLTFYEEVSRALIIFKSFRGNKKYYRALPVMDELIDYVNRDPISGKHLYLMNDEGKKRSTYELIDIPRDVIAEFKRLYHGHDYNDGEYNPEIEADPYDGVIGLKHLAPGNSIDARKSVVVIKKPLPVDRVLYDFPATWTAFIGGYSYMIQDYAPNGFPVQKLEPMIDWTKNETRYTFTYDIPYIVWANLFEIGWEAIAPICTRIERIVARALTDKGYNAGSYDPSTVENDSEDDGLGELRL